MGGRIRKPDPTPPQPAGPDDFEAAEARISTTEASLLKAKAGMEMLIDSGFAKDATFANHANVCRALTQLEVERRGQRKLRMAEVENLTMEKVLAWARSQSADKRSHLMRELQQMDSGGSVLA